MSISTISALVASGLLIVVALVALAVVFLTVHRRHVTISQISNGTGNPDLDTLAADFSENFRLAIGFELDNVRETMRNYLQKSVVGEGYKAYPRLLKSLQLPEIDDATLDRQNDMLNSLRASLAAASPAASIAAQLQAIGELIAQPRNATVTATLCYQPASDYQAPNDGFLALAVEVISPASHFRRRHRLWETPQSAEAPHAQQISALIQPAAHCAAIELASWALRKPRFIKFRRSRRFRDVQVHSIIGILMEASAATFRTLSERFERFSIDEFEAARDEMPGWYQPHYNLAVIREELGSASESGALRRDNFMLAVSEYRTAQHAARNLPAPAKIVIQRAITIRLVRAELLSDIPKLTTEALKWLEDQSLNIMLGCHCIRLHPEKIVLNKAAANHLYNSACMYAIAVGVWARRDWDQHARRLLGTALVIDGAEGDLWHAAPSDPDLVHISGNLPYFLAMLREALPDCSAGEIPLPEIVKLVDDVRVASRWYGLPRGSWRV